MFSLFFVLSTSSYAQISEVYIGVNGLTCSQCTRNVEMSLRQLPFVSDVKMSLEQTEGKITFYPKKAADIDKIAKAIIKAGFSLRFLKADINFDQVKVSDDKEFDLNDIHYQVINTEKSQLKGVRTVQYLGPKFMDKSDLKRWSSMMHTNSNQTYFYVTVI